MKQKRKNRFFTFIFSFLPGAAEMYMGFMKNGASIMALFFLCAMFVMFFGSMDFLSVLGLLVWFIGFFHARNYAGMTDEEFATMEDKYVWDEFMVNGNIKFSNTKSKNIFAVILIALGAGILWNYFADMIYSLIPGDYWSDVYPFVSQIPEVVIAVLLVVAGIFMIKGKKKEIEAAPDVEVKRIAEIVPQQEAVQVQADAQESKEA